jgi:hypothetical protein
MRSLRKKLRRGFGARPLLISCRISIVTSVAPPRSLSSPLAGASRSSVSEDRRTAAKGLPSMRCAQRTAPAASSTSTRSKSARTVLPLRVFMTSVKASSRTSSTRVTRGHHRGRWCGSEITAHRSSAGAAIVRLRRALGIAEED